jgi:hypothetical protein
MGAKGTGDPVYRSDWNSVRYYRGFYDPNS